MHQGQAEQKICHKNQLTVKALKKAVQDISWGHYMNLTSRLQISDKNLHVYLFVSFLTDTDR